MIITTSFWIGDKEFVKHISNKGLYIERDGIQYASATDLAKFNYEYTETDKPIYPKEEWDKLPQEIKEGILKDMGATGQEQIILAL